MACASVFDAFRLATEYLGEELYRRASYKGIWINLIPRGTYKRGSGLTLSTFTVGRSEPTSDSETWVKLTSVSNGGSTPGACSTTWNDANYGMNEVTYQPEGFGLRGPVICSDELTLNFNAERFLEAYLQELNKRSRRSIENRLLNLYSHFVPKNVTNTAFTKYAGGTGTVPTGGPTLTSLAVATCELSQEHLDAVAIELNEEGANEPNSNGWITLGDNGPEYPLYIGQELSQQIALNNSEFRQDIRWGEPSQLLKRMGATRVIKSFRHIINLFPPRFNYFAGQGYVRVNTWLMSAGTKGFVADINPSWRAAAYEGVYVLNPWVFTSHIVPPTTSAAGLNWSPVNYMGEWQWKTGGKNITDNDEQSGADCYDPLEKLGRHFAEYKHAPEPIFPQYGRMIIAKRCPGDYACSTCTS